MQPPCQPTGTCLGRLRGSFLPASRWRGSSRCWAGGAPFLPPPSWQGLGWRGGEGGGREEAASEGLR